MGPVGAAVDASRTRRAEWSEGELGDTGEERDLQTTRPTEGERVTGSCEGEREASAGSGLEEVEEGGESQACWSGAARLPLWLCSLPVGPRNQGWPAGSRRRLVLPFDPVHPSNSKQD